MNPIDLIFKLLSKFVPMDDASYSKAYSEGKDWWLQIRIDSDTKDNGILVMYKKFATKWYGVVAHAILYLVLFKEITNILSSNNNQEKNDEEDDD